MRPAGTDPAEIETALWRGFHGHVGWDIGANCGQTLPQMTSRFAQVHAFEPATECHPWLRSWALDAAMRYGTVRIWPVAVSDTDHTVDLIALPDKIDTGQLVTASVHGMEWNPDTPDAVRRTVPARTVDSLVEDIGPPDFLKIDVEGHEMRVLAGAFQTLTDYHPDLLIEFHSPQLHERTLECLRHHRYLHLETIRHPHYSAGSPLWHQHGWIRAHHRMSATD